MRCVSARRCLGKTQHLPSILPRGGLFGCCIFFPLRLNDLCDTQPEGLLVLALLFSPQIRTEFVLEFVGGWQERARRRSNRAGGAMR